MTRRPPKSTPFPPPTLSRSDPASGTVGATFKDTAKLSGLFGAHAGGTVSFKLFDQKSSGPTPSRPNPSDAPLSVEGNGEYSTPHGAPPTQARTYDSGARHSG